MDHALHIGDILPQALLIIAVAQHFHLNAHPAEGGAQVVANGGQHLCPAARLALNTGFHPLKSAGCAADFIGTAFLNCAQILALSKRIHSAGQSPDRNNLFPKKKR